jgi:hypothetical protein
VVRNLVVSLSAIVVVALAGVGSVASAETGAVSLPPAVVGLTTDGTQTVIAPLDPRTLRLVPHGWQVRVDYRSELVRSPAGTAVAALDSENAVVVDTRTGRVIQRTTYDGSLNSDVFYWTGGERRFGAREGASIVSVRDDCWSGGCSETLSALFGVGNDLELDAYVMAAVPYGLLSSFSYGPVSSYSAQRFAFDLVDQTHLFALTLPPKAFRVVPDVLRGRLYFVSSGGVVVDGEDHPSAAANWPSHEVDLNGQEFQAAWAGDGKIALWGHDGLGTIDVRSWKTNSIIGGTEVTDAVATRYGIAAWTALKSDGLAVYRPDGTRRFTVLKGQTILKAENLGRYLYVNATHRYAMDLARGTVIGRVPDNVRLALPSYTAIP